MKIILGINEFITIHLPNHHRCSLCCQEWHWHGTPLVQVAGPTIDKQAQKNKSSPIYAIIISCGLILGSPVVLYLLAWGPLPGFGVQSMWLSWVQIYEPRYSNPKSGKLQGH